MDETMTLPQRRAALALLILRLTLALFLFQWAMEKFLHPEYTVAISQSFYSLEIGTMAWLPSIIGVVQLLLVIGLVLGIFKPVTYGVALIMHAITTAVTIPQLLDPYGTVSGKPYYHLFIAGVPVLGAFIALYLMRDFDRYDVKLSNKRKM